MHGVDLGFLERSLVPKDEEIVVDRMHELSNSTHDVAYYERELTRSFAENRRVLAPHGIATIVFASKETSSWEAILQAVCDAGWTITGSWPIDTELADKVAAIGQARLMSSIHLACRPRENQDGFAQIDEVGDWREVLAELPKRVHEWMPRLDKEGVVGADAIFACLGPALEIFSRYSRVEKASGEQVTLKEYLEHVWAAVAKEALALVFEGADTAGFEEDARLTAMWLWTLRTDQDGIVNGELPIENGEPDEEEEDKSQTSKPKIQTLTGYVLEYDAARKIAQGLGAHLEQLASLIEVKGDKARLLPVEERAKYLFGKDSIETYSKRKKKERQLTLFEIVEEAEPNHPLSFKERDGVRSNISGTVLDNVHKSMLLFATGRSEALRRFLVDDGVGRDQRFWKLAQALSALYPKSSDEKRWVDGMLARKKGLGF